MTSEPTAVQIIHNTQGKPAYVVIPYEHYVAQQKDPNLIPHAVVSRLVDGATPIRAWREHLGARHGYEQRVQSIIEALG